MLSTNYIAIPNWQDTQTVRLGIQFRQNHDRFVYIKKHGWFVYVRSELSELSGLIYHGELWGPFADKVLAHDCLNKYFMAGNECVFRGYEAELFL